MSTLNSEERSPLHPAPLLLDAVKYHCMYGQTTQSLSDDAYCPATRRHCTDIDRTQRTFDMLINYYAPEML